ncbi:MAG TPA: hypothetical protein VK052_00445 [Zeimonas sp.]|nr:hypothetical protein [Zeimonas sp.]
MTLDAFDSLIDMPFNRTVELSGFTGTEVVCVRGRLWVVDPRQGGHRILSPGESCRIGHDGGARVTALEPSLMCAIELPAQRRASPEGQGGRRADRRA